MTTPTCKDCKYFAQHYVKLKHRQLLEINCGHCKRTQSKNKIKESKQTACVHFTMRDLLEEKNSRNKTLRELVENIHDKLETVIETLE